MRRLRTELFIGALCAVFAFNATNGMSETPDTSPIYEAPFNILGESGKPILTVEETENGPQMTLHGAEGRSIRIGSVQSGDGMAISLLVGERRVSLLANSTGMVVNLVSGTSSIALIDNGDKRSLEIKEGEATLVDLGIRSGRNAVLRIGNPQGTEVASLGSSPDYGGNGVLLVKDGSSKTSAFMLSQTNGAGKMGIVVGNTEVAKLEPNSDSSGGKVTLSDTSGTVAANMGSAVGGGGALCVFGKTRNQCIHPK